MVIEHYRLSICVVGAVLYHLYYVYYLLSILVRTTTQTSPLHDRRLLLFIIPSCFFYFYFFYARLYIAFITIRVYCIIIILLSDCTSVSYGKLTEYTYSRYFLLFIKCFQWNFYRTQREKICCRYFPV